MKPPIGEARMRAVSLIALVATMLHLDQKRAYAEGVFDELGDSTGWRVLARDSSYGRVEFTHGNIVILRHPTGAMNDVGVEKDYVASFHSNTWLHALVRYPRAMLGADMYTVFRLNQNDIVAFNVNGEEHWTNEGGRCREKRRDDSMHIGIAADNRDYLTNQYNRLEWTNDVPVAYPASVDAPYSNWTLYSAKFHVPADGVARWRLFVDGTEIVYRDTGYLTPDGQFQNVATIKPTQGINQVSVKLTVLGDGDLYKAAKGYAGAQQRRCFSDLSPFWVDESQTALPATARVEWDLVMMGNGNEGDFELNAVKSLIYAGKVSTSTAVLTEMISWQDSQFNCPYVLHDEIRRVRRKLKQAPNFCEQRVKDDIFGGHIGAAEAVLNDSIPWQNAQVNCAYMSEEEKNQVRVSPKGSPDFCR